LAGPLPGSPAAGLRLADDSAVTLGVPDRFSDVYASGEGAGFWRIGVSFFADPARIVARGAAGRPGDCRINGADSVLGVLRRGPRLHRPGELRRPLRTRDMTDQATPADRISTRP
jgi:hypothetical protein